MNYPIYLEFTKPFKNTSHELFDIFSWKSRPFDQIFEKISSSQDLHDDIEAMFWLKHAL